MSACGRVRERGVVGLRSRATGVARSCKTSFAYSRSMNVQRRSRRSATLPRRARQRADTPTPRSALVFCFVPSRSVFCCRMPSEHQPNRLIHERSLYLLQHAHNPVDWYPWGPEAFQKAQTQKKPIFLSIGYSTCHWCHVMSANRSKTQLSQIF